MPPISRDASLLLSVVPLLICKGNKEHEKPPMVGGAGRASARFA